MAINVNFWQSFAKRRNSTKQPDPNVKVTIPCVLKDNTSKEHPVFVLKNDPNQDPSRFNYCSSWGYYYFIDSREYVPPHWYLHCTMDVMATYKIQIGNSRLYVTRSATGYWNGRLLDNVPAMAKPKYTRQEFTNIWNTTTGGSYIVTLICDDGSDGVAHLVMSPAEYRVFVDSFFDTIDWDDPQQILESEVKALLNPWDYIKDVRWYPFTPTRKQNSVQIKVGSFTTHATGYPMTEGYREITSEVQYDVPKHPQADLYGDYLNTANYSNYTWVDPFCGTISIDANSLSGANKIGYRAMVDPSVGFGYIFIDAIGPNGSRSLIAQRTAEFGVPVLFTSQSRDFIGALGNSVNNLATGNWGNLVKDWVNINVNPKTETIGSQASKIMYIKPVFLYCEFTEIEPIDRSILGYPCCKTYRLGDLSGFVQCQTGDVEIAGSTESRSEIKNYLEGGFFYE